MKLSAFALAAALALPSLASADEVVLRNGSAFTGAVREEGDRVIVEMDYGTLSFKKIDVRSIRRGEDILSAFEARVGKSNGPKDLVDAALWGREKGLSRRADDLLHRVLQLDPDHAEARRALGYERLNNQWLRGDDLLVARGMAKIDGRWVSRDEAQRHLDRQLASQVEADRNALDARIAAQQHEQEMLRLALERERIEIERQEAEKRTANLERLRIELDRMRWYGYSRYQPEPLWCEQPVCPPAQPHPLPPPSARRLTPSPRNFSSLPPTPPTVLPIRPPSSRPITRAPQPPPKNNDKEEDEKEKRR